MIQNYYRHNIANKIVLIGLILIPFMSLPVMPSDYRPISIFFFLPIGMLLMMQYFANFRVQKDIFVITLFLMFCIFHSMILVGDITLSMRALIPLFIGVISYVAMKFYIQKYGIDYLFSKYLYLFYFIAILGIIEILSMYGVLPYIFKQLIGEIFSTKVSSRIQLITMEGSWAAKIIIFSIPIYIYHYLKNGYFHKSFFILMIIFLFIFSLEGFAIVLSAILLYFMYKFIPITVKFLSFKYKIKYYLYLLLFIFGSFIIIQFVLSTQTGYAVSRIYKFLDADSFMTILSLDGSTFIRVIYPYIGFLIFWDNPIGVGLGGYAEAFNSYINNIPINYSKFGEVMGDIATVSADPKNLYSKIMSETGIVGIWIFLSFIFLQLKYLRFNIKNLPQYKLFFISNILLGITCVIQFGSFAYLAFWFAFALNSAIYYRLKRGYTI
jgi:hypothetical protein